MMIDDKRLAEIEALANEWKNGFPSMAKVDALISSVPDLLSDLKEARSLLAQCREAIDYGLCNIETPPDARCSCHNSPPCGDCIDYGAVREAFVLLNRALKALGGNHE